MNFPVVIGLPQVLLFILAIVGIGLLISTALGMSGRGIGKHRDYEEEEARKFGERRRYRRPWRIGRGIFGLVLLLLALSLLWLTLLVQTYLGLTSNIKVARVHATPVANSDHLMSVELTLYDQNGHQTSDQTYLVKGDDWRLEGDIIKFPTWLNIFGLHSGYKLTRMEGRYEDPHLESSNLPTVIELNGGDDNFFKTVQEQAWVSPVVEAAYGSGTFLRADSKTYNVFVSQTGLFAEPAK
jgi:hypothetical protein